MTRVQEAAALTLQSFARCVAARNVLKRLVDERREQSRIRAIGRGARIAVDTHADDDDDDDDDETVLLDWTSYRERLAHRVRRYEGRPHRYHGDPSILPPTAPDTWTSEQVRHIESDTLGAGRGKSRVGLDWDGARMRARLRPEDRTDAPMVRIRNGVVVDWNRAMGDLTGLSRTDVVGKTYAELIRSVPLSDKYRAAATHFAALVGTEAGAYECSEWKKNDPWNLEGATFPLPLPICSAADAGRGLWIELFVKWDDANADHWKWTRRSSCAIERRESDCEYWLSGKVFTLRSNGNSPVPPDFFRPFNPGEPHLRSDDGGPSGLKAQMEKCKSSNQIKFLVEAFETLRRLADLNSTKRSNKIYEFSCDWSVCPDTRDIYRHLFEAVGGEQTLIESTCVMNKQNILRWQATGKNADQYTWRKIVRAYSPVLARICPRYPANGIPLTMVPLPDPHAVLTLKIEVVEETGFLVRNRYDDWEQGGAKWAVVNVPAWLSLAQLHRVAVKTMTGSNHAGGTCHRWTYKNPLAYDFLGVESYDKARQYIQIQDHTGEDHTQFYEGVRQRLAPDGAFVKHPGAFLDNMELENGGYSVPTVCAHRFSVFALFYRKGAAMRLEDGFTRYGQDYLITLQKTEAKGRSRTSKPPVQCLRGKAFRNDDHWSVSRANAVLSKDGYLRENLSRDTDDDCSLVLPWCHVNPQYVTYGERYVGAVPLALHAVGADLQPVALKGEPPLPADGDEYRWYTMDDPEEFVSDGLSTYGVNDVGEFRGGDTASCSGGEDSY